MGTMRMDRDPLQDVCGSDNSSSAYGIKSGADEIEKMAGGCPAAAAAAVEAGEGDGTIGGQGRMLLALPDAMLSEILGNLDVKGLGRAGCACRVLRDTADDERLWVSLWEGPLPGGFLRGEKAAHVALWLLAKGEVEQTRVAVSEPSSPTRTASRRRVGEATATGGGRDQGHGGARGEEGPAGGGAVAVAAGFPVHISCMAINGAVIATAAGPEITVWGMEGASAPRARFKVSGHGSVTCLLLRSGTLLAGDNSGYLRSYDVSVPGGGRPLHEIRAHADRVTAIDSFTLPVGNTATADSPLAEQPGGGSGGCYRRPAAEGEGGAWGRGGGQRGRWDQGHGWGEGWQEEESESGEGAQPLLPQRHLYGNSGASSSSPPPHASWGAAGEGAGSRQQHGNGGGTCAWGESPASAAGLGVDFNRVRRGSSHGGGTGEPLSRLGKRQGYAGRGQAYEPAGAAVGGGTRMQGRGRGIDRVGWAFDDGNNHGAPNAWSEEKGGEENDPFVGQRPDDGKGGAGGEQREVLLFTASDDGTAKAWDARSGRFVCLYAGHTRGVTCLQATLTESYGPVLVTGGGDSAVIVWELTTGRCLEKLETGAGLVINPGGPGPRVGCLQAYRDTIVVGEDRHVSVWSLRKGQRPRLARARFCEHQRPIRRLDMVGPWIVTCSGDYVIRLWDSRTGVCVRELGTKSGAAITSFRLSGLCLLTTSLFDTSVLMTSFSQRRGSEGKGSA
ncbi:unnamed protein product [Ectocarpus sp. 6 AP-2014]